MINTQRSEARRSIVVQVNSEHSCPELYAYCSQYGSVKGLHHYYLPSASHFVVVEFETEVDVTNILAVSSHIGGNHVIPVRSPFLWFRAGAGVKSPTSALQVPVREVNGSCEPTRDELSGWLQQAQSLSDQILILHRATQLDNLGSRLRFISAHQIEQVLSGPFPLSRAMPFGSSVNGFGRLGCDLDLVLQLDKDVRNEDSQSRLVYHAKTSLANDRTQAQRHMETIGDMCQRFLPGCSGIKRILQARVPIIKYRQELTGVDCDLSMTNGSAVHMSELLFVMGSVDPRVRPLVFAVRAWARSVGLTNPTPGRWLTNFSLTLLVLFYLQQTMPPVLPTLETLRALADPADRHLTSNDVNCTFLRDVGKLCRHMQRQPANTDSLETLLLNFFEFYSSFDFATRALSLAHGSSIPKPEHSALYIVNPLEQGLNVSKNVSPEETERMRIELRNAAWTLESAHQRTEEEPWGLVAVCQASQIDTRARNLFYLPGTDRRAANSRLVEVSDLFADTELSVQEEKSSQGTRDNSVAIDIQVSAGILGKNTRNVQQGPKLKRVVKAAGRQRRR